MDFKGLTLFLDILRLHKHCTYTTHVASIILNTLQEHLLYKNEIQYISQMTNCTLDTRYFYHPSSAQCLNFLGHFKDQTLMSVWQCTLMCFFYLKETSTDITADSMDVRVDMVGTNHNKVLTQWRHMPMGQFRANIFLIPITSTYFWASEVFKNRSSKSWLFWLSGWNIWKTFVN